MPKRTTRKSVWEERSAGHPSTSLSAIRFVAPMMLEGRTALSVEISTKRPTPCRAAHCATFAVPTTLLRAASSALASIIGTCL